MKRTKKKIAEVTDRLIPLALSSGQQAANSNSQGH